MEHIFWAIPGKLAGRPGPNLVPWDPTGLRREGFSAVLTVNHGVDVDPAQLQAAGLAHRRVRFPGGIPPNPDALEVALEALPVALDFYREHSTRGPVLVHCSFGKDRTGLFIAHALVQEQGLAPDDALARLREVRPNALSATGWHTLARDVLHHIATAD